MDILAGTYIEGVLTEKEAEEALNNARTYFEGKRIQGYLNSKPAKYVIKVEESFNKNFLLVNLRFNDDVYNYGIESNAEDFRNFTINLATLFPHHGISILNPDNKYFFEEQFPEAFDYLKKLGYSHVEEGKYDNWRLGLLAFLRNPELKVNAFDRRAIKIFDCLSCNLESAPESYTLGIFTPKHWKKMKDPELGYGGFVEKSHELVVNKIKKLVPIPSRIAESELERLSKGLPLTRAIGLTSLVKIKEEEKHIPMIDFSGRDTFDIENTLEYLGMPGMIVSSGKSYHFYGFNLLNLFEWNHFLEKINRAGSVDNNWVGLQLKQGFSMLRLTPVKRKLYQPCFYSYFKPKADKWKKPLEEFTEIRPVTSDMLLAQTA